MAAQFKLEILTPDRLFFSGTVEAVTIDCPDGELTVLAGHAPMVASLTVGSVRLKIDGQWNEAFHSEGFLEVRPDETLIFSQACEWPGEIDLARAERTRQRLAETAVRGGDAVELRRHEISLARAAERIRLAKIGKK